MVISNNLEVFNSNFSFLYGKRGSHVSETVQVRGDSGAELRKGSFRLQPPEEIDVKIASPWRSYQFSHW